MNHKTDTLKSEGARVLLHKSAQWYVKELGRKNGSWGSLENAVSRLENAAIQFAESGAKPMNCFNPKIIKHD